MLDSILQVELQYPHLPPDRGSMKRVKRVKSMTCEKTVRPWFICNQPHSERQPERSIPARYRQFKSINREMSVKLLFRSELRDHNICSAGQP